MEKTYRNQEILNYVENLAEDLIKQKFSNCYRDHFFPLMIDKLDLKIGAEIGVDKGEFSLQILEKSKLEKLYCVDSWCDEFGSDYKPGYYDPNGNVRFDQCYNTLKNYIDTNRVEMVRADSVEASKVVQEELDYLFIDGDHSLEGVFNDIYNWVPKVKIGGIIGFHDYKDGPKSGIKNYWGGQLDFAVKTVADYYCERYGYKINSVGNRIPSAWFVKI